MKNKLTADGQKITPAKIAGWNQSYREFGMKLSPFVSNDGEGFLLNAVKQDMPCGCKVTGNGTIQFPLTIKPCARHAKHAN